MKEFWGSFKLTVAEIGGKILAVLITVGTLAATIWALLARNKKAEQDLAQAKADKELAVTMAKLAETKGDADELEKKYNKALADYHAAKNGTGEPPVS